MCVSQLEWYIQLDDGGWRVERFVRHFATQAWDRQQEQREQNGMEKETDEEEEQELLVGEEEEEEAPGRRGGGEAEPAWQSDIEAVLAHRFMFGHDQWQVRWRRGMEGGESELSWERWAVLDTPELQEAAKAIAPEGAKGVCL